jgi:hypothetical protein
MKSGSLSSYRAASDPEAWCGGSPDEEEAGPIKPYDLWRRNDDPNPDDIGKWIGSGFNARDEAIAFAVQTGAGIYDVVGRNVGQLIRVEADGSVIELPYSEEA